MTYTLVMARSGPQDVNRSTFGAALYIPTPDRVGVNDEAAPSFSAYRAQETTMDSFPGIGWWLALALAAWGYFSTVQAEYQWAEDARTKSHMSRRVHYLHPHPYNSYK